MKRARNARRIAMSSLVAVAVLMPMPMASQARAAAGSCKVEDKDTHHSYPDLPSAVSSASSGATLLVTGSCASSSTTLIRFDLTIEGRRNPTLSLRSGASGSVVNVGPGSTVGITGVTITGGGNGVPFGGGVANFGNLTLTQTTVANNNVPTVGGGIYNDGTLTLDSSTVENNAAAGGPVNEGDGGGLYNDVGATMTINNSSVTHNSAGGTDAFYGIGGGMYVAGGTVTLSGTTSVTANTAAGSHGAFGGGIWVQPGVGTLIGATDGGNVTDNTPDNIDG